MADNDISDSFSNEEVFNTIVDYRPIEAKKPVYGPLTEIESKIVAQEFCQLPQITSTNSSVLSSVKMLYTNQAHPQHEMKNDAGTLRPKDSAIIHCKKQKNKAVKHKLEICFKLPPQEAMILECHKIHPIKQDTLQNIGTHSFQDIHETKSVRFSEHMVTPIVVPGIKKTDRNYNSKNRIKNLQYYQINIEKKKLELLELKILREREAFRRECERERERLAMQLSSSIKLDMRNDLKDSDI